MKKFIYTGPMTGVTLNGSECLLFPGGQVELPEDSSFVQGLLDQGRLTPVPDEEPETLPVEESKPEITEEPKPANKPRKGD